MSGAVRLAAMSGVALLGFAVLASIAAALADRAVAGMLRASAPSVRARLLVAWGAAPFAIAAALVGLVLAPSLGVALGLAVDHCPAHAGHVHLCVHHLPAHGAGIAGALALAVLAAAAGSALVRGLREAALAADLSRARSSELAPGVALLESPRPFAMAVGWVRPAVLVSTALVHRLTPAHLGVVVAHERAHRARRDALWLAAVRVLSLAHLPFVRRRILGDLALACEQACDEAAARACGDRVLVAEAIVAAERAAAAVAAGRPAGPATGLAFGGGEVAARVEALLAPSVVGAAPVQLRWVLLAAAAALVAAAPHVHHWTETLLHRLPH
jgi:Zn-dependent protease with chaperone function